MHDADIIAVFNHEATKRREEYDNHLPEVPTHKPRPPANTQTSLFSDDTPFGPTWENDDVNDGKPPHQDPTPEVTDEDLTIQITTINVTSL